MAAPAFAATTRYDVGITDDPSLSPVYTLPNPWTTSAPAGVTHFGGSVRFSQTANATATYSFTGTGVNLVYATWFNRGIAAVSVDGGPEVLVNMYSAGSGDPADPVTGVKTQQVAPIASGLTNGPHTITVRVTGNTTAPGGGILVNVDALDVITPDPPVYTTPASSTWSILAGIVLAGVAMAVVARRRTA